MLAAHSVSLTLGGRQVLQGVDFALRPGECVALLGPNGAGKTSLVRVLAGLAQPQAGSVSLDGAPSARLDRRLRARAVGYLEQASNAAWPMAGRDIVMLGRLPHRGPFAGPSAEDQAAVERALVAADAVPFTDRPLSQLSGGERARVLLARLLAGEPRFILADEPIAGLDPAHQLHALEVMASRAAAGCGVAVVLHDVTLALRFASRICLIDRGRVAAEGAPGSILASGALEAVYGVSFHRGEVEGRPFALPLRVRGSNEG